MKKLLLLVSLILTSGAWASDLSVDYTRTFLAADTINNAFRADTLYTPWQDLRPYRRFWLGIQYFSLMPWDTEFVTDSLDAWFQTSMNKKTVWTYGSTVVLNPPIVADSSGIVMKSTLCIKPDSFFVGQYGRMMFIVTDSMEADAPTLINKTIYKRFVAWIRETL